MKQSWNILDNCVKKNNQKYACDVCDYSTSNKSQYNRHLITDKHRVNVSETHLKQNETQKVHQCVCGIIFNSRTTLWRHKKTCTKLDTSQTTAQSNFITPELLMELIRDNKEMKQIILEQNNTINNLVKNGVVTNNTITQTNSNNNAFNLNFFLNETCKNAMNMNEFLDSINLQLSDIVDVGKLGYVEGMSKIIAKNLNDIDETLRPIHCTDKKRETFYIKDENKWTKEEDDRKKIKKFINTIANKNIKLLPVFRETYPDYSDSSSKMSDKYDKIVLEVMGGAGNNDLEKEDKIIRNISKCVVLNK